MASLLYIIFTLILAGWIGYFLLIKKSGGPIFSAGQGIICIGLCAAAAFSGMALWLVIFWGLLATFHAYASMYLSPAAEKTDNDH